MFGGRSRFTRHIDPDQLLQNRRPAPDAFMPNPGDSHLSIHSLGHESKKSIATRYRTERQGSRGAVRVSIHSIYEYNKASKDTPAEVWFSATTRKWEFADKNGPAEAYKHRPTATCSSHCGIEYVRALDMIQMLRVARRLAEKSVETIR
jgi:hypothetical protein